jgi:pseudouridine-5'-phosphate glycosidase
MEKKAEMTPTPLLLSDEVRSALDAGRAVVALESTIIAHGMPYPGNLETAISLQSIVRARGAVPATIAVLAGKLRVGLSEAELERIARDGTIAKASTRDLPILVARGADGATTVAATMRIAAMAGIPVFATGGIGGVHRGWDKTFDISADLTELAASEVAVVCAGAKAILDLPATLERLETLGVPVIAYRSDEFPAFYSRSSGLKAPCRCESVADIVAIIRTARELNLRRGTLIANPVPVEDEIPAREMEDHIRRAVEAASLSRVAGGAVTPYLLAELARRTQGRSQKANMALVRNNTALAADLALALAGQRR